MGSIDNPKYMQNSRVWLFSGQKDTIVDTGAHTRRLHMARFLVLLVLGLVTYIGPYPGVVKKAKMYYEYYITNASSVAMVTNISSEHAWITNKYGPLHMYMLCFYCLISPILAATGVRATTWVTPTSTIAIMMRAAPCFATSILNRSLILALPPSPPTYAPACKLFVTLCSAFVCDHSHRGRTAGVPQIFAFSQEYYTPAPPASISMGQTGYVYVATACQQGARMLCHHSQTTPIASTTRINPFRPTAVCKLVVAFHGCEMSIPDIKNAYYVHSGLNEWAETNNVPYWSPTRRQCFFDS